jgi:hypothetical protein
MTYQSTAETRCFRNCEKQTPLFPQGRPPSLSPIMSGKSTVLFSVSAHLRNGLINVRKAKLCGAPASTSELLKRASNDVLGCDALRMETACFSETLVSTYESIWRQSPRHYHRHLRRENLRSHDGSVVYYMKWPDAITRGNKEFWKELISLLSSHYLT